MVIRLKTLLAVAGEANLTIVREPLNSLVDHPGCWLTRIADAVAILDDVGFERLKLLYDIYHQQITEGNVRQTILENGSWIGHFHAAGVPGRGPLVGGELDYRSIFSRIERGGYKGFVGLEYLPQGREESSLAEALAGAPKKE